MSEVKSLVDSNQSRINRLVDDIYDIRRQVERLERAVEDQQITNRLNPEFDLQNQ